MRLRRPTTYNVHEAKTHLPALLERPAHGEDVVIAKAGVPVARLVPLTRPDDARPLGTEQHRHALRMVSLPAHHRDPFDRLLVAQAQLENLPILTGDRAFRLYDVEVLAA
jgi:prevent-host-death family protein